MQLDTAVSGSIGYRSSEGSLGVVVEAANTDAVFFCAPKLIIGGGTHGWLARPDRRVGPASREEERCALQAKSSGSTTQRATGSSNARAGATCSSTTPPSRVTDSVPWKKARQLSSRSSTVPRARRRATSANPSEASLYHLPGASAPGSA